MPLIKPEIQKVLREANLLPEEKKKVEGTISDKLDAAGLSLDSVLEEMGMILRSSSNESLRARVGETIMKAHGALKESAPAAPSFTIVIQGGETPATPGVPSGINPFLIPRQLLKQLDTKGEQIQ